MRLRRLTKMRTPNDGIRSLVESSMSLDVIAALRDWTRTTGLKRCTDRRSRPVLSRSAEDDGIHSRAPQNLAFTLPRSLCCPAQRMLPNGHET